MKNIIWIFAVTFLVQYVSCNEALLSKFHQHSFKVKDLRFQLISYDEHYLNFMEFKTFRYNRTTTAHNGTLNPKIDLGDKIEILVQGFKFLSNEYRRIMSRFQVNFKKLFDRNVIGLKDEMKKCRNTTNFVFYKGITYHLLCNMIFDSTQLPPLIPTGQYKTEIQFLYEDHEIAMLHFFNEVYYVPIYPKD